MKTAKSKPVQVSSSVGRFVRRAPDESTEREDASQRPRQDRFYRWAGSLETIGGRRKERNDNRPSSADADRGGTKRAMEKEWRRLPLDSLERL